MLNKLIKNRINKKDMSHFKQNLDDTIEYIKNQTESIDTIKAILFTELMKIKTYTSNDIELMKRNFFIMKHNCIIKYENNNRPNFDEYSFFNLLLEYYIYGEKRPKIDVSLQKSQEEYEKVFGKVDLSKFDRY